MSAQTVVVAGGAGFIGSHVCDRLVERGDRVVCVDNLCTGRVGNLAGLTHHDSFDFLESDIARADFVDVWHDRFGDLAVDAVMHFASPASPAEYLRRPIETLDVGSAGTRNLLDLAVEHRARFFLASTSEVYGDPLVHPQIESYWGNVNPIGERSVYDESKRFAEALTMAFHRVHGLEVRIVRIFNTYGPRMQPADGRVVTNFVDQALRNLPITVFGDGSQTRSFCYVDDEVRGLLAALDGPLTGPINLGNPRELTVSQLAELVVELTGSRSEIVYRPLPSDDPKLRRPDITLARETLGWAPTVELGEGLRRTIAWFRSQLDLGRHEG